RGATRREVVQAYRPLARRHHPDAGGNPARFLEVQAAYDVLGDPQARARYDLQFAPPPAPPPPPRPASATRVHRYATAAPPGLPTPSSGALEIAVSLGLATFVLPSAAAAVVFGAHGSVLMLLLGLAAAL